MRNKSQGARDKARKLRNNPSVAEDVMWAFLENDKLGFHFRRQFPLGKYILDFYCPEAKLCVEMDSDLHDEEHDKKRDAFLRTQGIFTIRIPNVDSLALQGSPSRDWVKYIQQVCDERTGKSEY